MKLNLQNWKLLLLLIVLFTSQGLVAQTVTTFAGISGSFGADDGANLSAKFFKPAGVAVDAAGDVYVADEVFGTIRKISSGTVSTFATGFNFPSGLTIDAAGNVYVADRGNHRIRIIDKLGNVSTFAGDGTLGSKDGAGDTARFNRPVGVALDAAGNVYVADNSGHKVRKISPAGVVSTLAGSGSSGSTDGTGSAASFSSPNGIAVDELGYVYVADIGNKSLRRISPAGVVTTVGVAGSYTGPTGVAIDKAGNIYVADFAGYTIYKVSGLGTVTTLAGSGTSGNADGVGTAATFNLPNGIAVDAAGDLYIADQYNHTIRKITLPAAPEIEVKGNGEVIELGSNAPILSNGTDFGKVTASKAQNFTIVNRGTGALTISNIRSTGIYSGYFVVSNIPTSVAAGASADFTVTYTPHASSLSRIQGQIVVDSDDADEPMYSYALYGAKAGPCNLTAALPALAGTYTSTQSVTVGGYECFCDVNNYLLLALDLNGTGAVVPSTGVSLKIGATVTTAWNNAGGIITNTDGGAVFNRRWSVVPTTQPSTPVKVKYFFTKTEYDSIVLRVASLGTTITTPEGLGMYKLTTDGFDDPHANGVTGIVLSSGSTPSTTSWVYATQGADHSAEFLVSSFSGGGGGGGAGGAPLPVNLLDFNAKIQSNNAVVLNWSTASETNNSHFELERSYDGINFEVFTTHKGAGVSHQLMHYSTIDDHYNAKHSFLYYRIKQVDYDGKYSFGPIRLVEVHSFKINDNLKVHPNPSEGIVELRWSDDNLTPKTITILDLQGKVVYKSNISLGTKASYRMDLKELTKGIYILQVLSNDRTEQRRLILK